MGQGLVVMTNATQGSDLYMEMARAVARVYGWEIFQPKEKRLVKLAPALLERYTGKYYLPADPETVATVKRKDDHLFISVPVENWNFSLYPESETVFFMFEKEEPVIFDFDEERVAQGFAYGNFHLERMSTP
jgi:hypothetical protein